MHSPIVIQLRNNLPWRALTLRSQTANLWAWWVPTAQANQHFAMPWRDLLPTSLGARGRGGLVREQPGGQLCAELSAQASWREPHSQGNGSSSGNQVGPELEWLAAF